MSDQDFVYQFRLILLGDSTVGKSSILRQFKEGTHFPDISLTVGVDFHAKLIQVRGRPVKLQLWDTAGQDRFRAIVRAYYRNAVGGLLVYDICNRESFANLGVWLEDAQRNAEPHKPVFVLVGNKTDQSKHREVTKEEAGLFATRHGMDYYETSAKNGSNVDEVFHRLAKKIYALVDDGVIRIEEGWDGVKRGTELSHTSSNYSQHRNGGMSGQKYSTTITLGSGQTWGSSPPPNGQQTRKKCC
jgi:small GTP-binding protein